MARHRTTRARALVLGAVSLFAAGCGEGFDPPSELRALRVLGVHKDQSYPAPGSEVTLNLVWQDASPKAPRELTIAWLPPCFNPPGDLYYGCFAQFADPEVASSVGSVSQELRFRIPDDIVTSRPPPDPGNPAYGTAFGFFLICAGEVVPLIPPPSPNALPIGCREPSTGELLGPDDFIAGYTTLYSFAEGFSNQKPAITGFQVRGQDVPVECLGVDCAREGEPEPPLEPIDCTDPAESARCVPTCEDDGDAECPEIELRPLVDPSVAERDEVSAVYYGRNLGEQMWINYYVDRGGVRTDVRLLNDATTGWNDDYGIELFAPKEPGPFSVWAVTHDNRGAADFVRVRLQAVAP